MLRATGLVGLALALAFSLFSGAHADIIALYRFEGSTTSDLAGTLKIGNHSGQTYDGTGANSPALGSDVSGVNGGSQSLQLNGSNYVDIPIQSVNPFDGSEDFTITGWFKSTALGGNPIILSSARDNTPANHSLAFFLHSANGGNLRADNFYVNEVNTGSNLQNDGWHFGAITYTAIGNTYRIYLDDPSTPTTKNFNPAIPSIVNDTVRIGGTKNTTFPSSGAWNGYLDDVAVFDHTLSQAELASVKAGNFSRYVQSTNAYAAAVQAGSPLVYYRMEENPPQDYSGHAKDSTAAPNVALTSSASVVLGSAANFNNTNTAVAVPALGSGYDQLSMEAWVNPRSIVGGGYDPIFNVTGWYPGAIHWQLGNNSQVEVSINGNTVTDNWFTAGLSANNWYYLALTYDATAAGGTLKFYVDGSLFDTRTGVGTTSIDLSNGGALGSWGGSRWFDGQIDEFAAYGRVLSAAEIGNHYQLGLVPEPSTLAMLFGLGTIGLWVCLRRRQG